MYIAYGWPQVFPLDPGVVPPSSEDKEEDQIVLLKVAGGLLLVVARSHIEIWTSSQQHKVRVGKYVRDADSLRREGENVHAAWSPDTKSIAVLTSMQYLLIFKIQTSGGKKLLLGGGKQLRGPSLVNISLTITEKAPFADNENAAVTSNLVCDNKKILLGHKSGDLRLVSWKAEFSDVFKLHHHSSASADGAVVAHSFRKMAMTEGNLNVLEPILKSSSSVVKLELSLVLKLLVVLYSDGGGELCSISRKGLKSTDSVKFERWLNVEDAVCSSIASDQQILAVGCRRGVVELYDLAQESLHLRSVSLYDWGYSAEDTGPVSCIAWTPESSAFAVGWKHRGLTVWSVSGCRLMCTIRQIGINSTLSPGVKHNHGFRHEPLYGGTSFVHWDEHGYKLYAVERSSSERILGFSFGKCCLNRGLLGASFVRQVIFGEDRILVVQSGETDELKISHINLPVSYVSQNWPILHVVPSQDGMYLAIAGLHGLILYDLRGKRWRVFGDVSQEQKIQCKGLLWLGKIVVVCNYVESSSMYELLFYPRYHLDQSSLLCRKQLMGRPMVMDAFQDYILVTFYPFDVHIFHAKLSGDLTASANPILELSTIHELSIMTARSHPTAMRFLPDLSSKEGDSQSSQLFTCSKSSPRQPSRCLVLRTNGDLSLLDLDDGHEHELTDSVEMFWVPCEQSEQMGNLIEEVSWLDYGSRGMQVWYPSPGVDPFKREYFLQLDPELEFDREVYPLGLLPSAGVVVGVSQRMSFSACTEFPCFEPSPQAQTILHCLLRHLLQRDKDEEALHLASLSAEKPHFSHCLEWLLFTVFDADISRQNVHKNQFAVSQDSSLLDKTCNLIRNFPECLDVFVSVARKTDGRHWADLFSAAGRSTELFEECFQRRWYRTAACYILVIAKLEGPAVSQYSALRLLQATLDESLYDLAGELVRFLLRSGRDYENASTESDRDSPRFLGYFLFRTYRKQSFDLKSASFKESNAHIASVKNILENHASYLMSGKELSKLVAFVKGTQFDLVEYLQRERMGSARLENFTAGLELIGKKLRMDTLQNRLDAEFLLAHMCSVKFKEWIVVLATLLRRTEVLYDIFHLDMRLWDAYNTSIRSQRAFEEYHDLLEILEEQLSTVAD